MPAHPPPTGTSVLPDPRSERARWLKTLSQLESQLADAAHAAVAAHGAADGDADGATPLPEWAAPGDLGPLPADLVDRAERLNAAQRATLERLVAARRSTGQHLSALQSVPPVQQADRSVYLDVTG